MIPRKEQPSRHHTTNNPLFGLIHYITLCINVTLILVTAVTPGLFLLLLSLNTASSTTQATTTTPAPAQYFPRQLVDHLSSNNVPSAIEPAKQQQEYSNNNNINNNNKYNVEQPASLQYWTQRYYTSDVEFKGPGHPIFLILGGEGQISPSTGLVYPFVTNDLAKTFGAFVLQPEHRFYGESQPLRHSLNTNDDERRSTLLTPEQALHDAMRLLDFIRQDVLNCSKDKFSKNYCPVITVGGSYPGFLSALARIMFPTMVDMAYAASAPMLFYSQTLNSQYDYYNHITNVANTIYPGCANAVNTTLNEVQQTILSSSFQELSLSLRMALGICNDTIPDYIDNVRMFADELFMVVGYTFANDNMANYPPSNHTRLYNACHTFTSSSHLDAFAKVRQFLTMRLSSSTTKEKQGTTKNRSTSDCDCWNMQLQLPSGSRATISSGDWSGVGTGDDGESWDFQTCTLLVEAIGFSNEGSMFPSRDWSLNWLTNHCQNRFGVIPKPLALIKKYGFDNPANVNVTRIIFTNGMKDGWSVGGIQTNLSESVIALNFPNGAHHSDLSHQGPSEEDTNDIKQGFESVRQLLKAWLIDIQKERMTTTTMA